MPRAGGSGHSNSDFGARSFAKEYKLWHFVSSILHACRAARNASRIFRFVEEIYILSFLEFLGCVLALAGKSARGRDASDRDNEKQFHFVRTDLHL